MRALAAVSMSVLLLTGSAAASAQQSTKKFLTLEDAAVAEAKHWQQTGVAKPIMSDDGRVLYPFGQYLPRLTCTELRACDIQLEPGELMEGMPVAGDSVRWKFTKRTSGEGDNQVIHVIVKPVDLNIETNLIITTNRRTYQVDLIAASNDRDYVNIIGFYYPEEISAEWDDSAKIKAKEEKAHDKLVADDDMPVGSVDKLDFDYEINGDSRFKPVRVYNDGLKVHIQMPDSIVTSEAPVLVMVGKDGKPEVLNYRPKTATLYEVDKLFDKAEMILGADSDQEKVTITWMKGHHSFWSRTGGQ